MDLARVTLTWGFVALLGSWAENPAKRFLGKPVCTDPGPAGPHASCSGPAAAAVLTLGGVGESHPCERYLCSHCSHNLAMATPACCSTGLPGGFSVVGSPALNLARSDMDEGGISRCVSIVTYVEKGEQTALGGGGA